MENNLDMMARIDGLFSAVDTVWVLLAAILIFMMQLGFASVEAGFTRSKNTANILMKNLLDFCFGCIFSFKESFCFCDRRLQFVSGSFRILSGSGSFGYRIQKRLCMINGSLKLFSNFAVRLYSNSNGYFLFVEFL